LIFLENSVQINTEQNPSTYPTMNEEIYIFCPDCRGKFEVELADIVEGEVLECSLCGAEIEILQENPIKIQLLKED